MVVSPITSNGVIYAAIPLICGSMHKHEVLIHPEIMLTLFDEGILYRTRCEEPLCRNRDFLVLRKTHHKRAGPDAGWEPCEEYRATFRLGVLLVLVRQPEYCKHVHTHAHREITP